VTAYKGSANLLDYSSTKGAIVSFTRSLSQALAETNSRQCGGPGAHLDARSSRPPSRRKRSNHSDPTCL
jgi:hypothetical protein